jgi:sRNA-binding protein
MSFPSNWLDQPTSAALTLGSKKHGKQWSACCPAHDDKSPSLIIFEALTGTAQARCMAEWFPQTFVAEKYLPHRPLKIGIHINLKDRCPELSEYERSAFLRYYVARPLYLRACVVGAPRIDLDGNVCGEVTTAEAQHADARLAAILAARARKQELTKSRAAAKPAAPRNKEEPPEQKPPAPRRDGLAALREAAAKRRTIA